MKESTFHDNRGEITSSMAGTTSFDNTQALDKQISKKPTLQKPDAQDSGLMSPASPSSPQNEQASDAGDPTSPDIVSKSTSKKAAAKKKKKGGSTTVKKGAGAATSTKKVEDTGFYNMKVAEMKDIPHSRLIFGENN